MDAQQTNDQLREALAQSTKENEELRAIHSNTDALFSNSIEQIISILPQPTLVVNSRLIVKECNQPAIQWIGNEKNQISGQVFSSFFPFNTESIERKLKEAMENEKRIDFTHTIEILRASHNIRFSIVPFKSLSGNYSLLISFSNQNKDNYEEQEKNEQIYLLTSVLNAARDRYILCNNKGEILFANKSAVKMLTKHPVIHEKTNLFSLLSRNKVSLYKKYFLKTLETNSILTFNEKRNKRYYHYKMTPLLFSGYNSNNILIHCQEVTSQKEEVLRCTAQLVELQQLLNSANTAMLVMWQNGDIDFINKKGLEFYKFINDRRVKKNFFDLLTLNSKSEIISSLHSVLEPDKEVEVTVTYKKQLNFNPNQHKIHIKDYYNSDNQEHKLLVELSET